MSASPPYGWDAPVLYQLSTAAKRLAMLRRRLDPKADYSLFLVDEVGDALESIDMQIRSSAGELVAAGVFDVDAALAQVDAEQRRFRSLLGRETR